MRDTMICADVGAAVNPLGPVSRCSTVRAFEALRVAGVLVPPSTVHGNRAEVCRPIRRELCVAGSRAFGLLKSWLRDGTSARSFELQAPRRPGKMVDRQPLRPRG